MMNTWLTWGAEPLGMIGANLTLSQSDTNSYYYQDAVSTHPGYRNRIKALLLEVYGNGIFGNAGIIGDTGEFTPDRDNDGAPINEDGIRVTNWDSEIEPAIDDQVDSDLSKLDKLVAGGLTDTEKAEFKQHVAQAAERLKREHSPEFQAAPQPTEFVSDKQRQLAEGFRCDGYANSEITQSSIAQEPKIAQCYAAHYCASEHIDSSKLGFEAKIAIKAMVQEIIAQGIERDEYPQAQRQEVVETAAEHSSEPE